MKAPAIEIKMKKDSRFSAVPTTEALVAGRAGHRPITMQNELGDPGAHTRLRGRGGGVERKCLAR